MSRGVWYAVGAYIVWGLLPIYWKILEGVPALQLISHRIIWSFVLLALIVAIWREWRAFFANARAPRVLGVYALAAVLVGVNWLTYVWAVNAGHIVETSLGYFINPLISIVFGVALLRERLRAWQWVAVGLAGTGVVYLTFDYGRLPWIALTLAVTFALYGLVKKFAPLGSVHGLALETGILLVPALGVLAAAEARGGGAFLHSYASTNLLLVGAGVVTTVPLLLFASAARRIPLTLIGVLQYIAPTLQFCLGVFVYRETITAHTLFGFGLVWAALALFGVEGVLSRRQSPFPAVAE